MGGMLEVINRGDSWEDPISNEEDEVQEGPELDCLTVSGALGVLARPEAKV